MVKIRAHARQKQPELAVQGGVRKSSRRKKVEVARLPLHFRSPKYATESREAGGKKSTAVLSPNSLKEMGTDANSSLPSGIKLARKRYPKHNFKAGHLLNADFYGYGKDYKNLTILTAAANTQMTRFDNALKEAVRQLHKLYQYLSERFVDITKIRVGIKVEISVSGEKWGHSPPDSYIAKSVTCKAEITEESDMKHIFKELPHKERSQAERILANIKTKVKNANGKINNK